jgi:hypothetical protein
MEHNTGTAHPAVIAVWAALVASGHLLPAILILGTGRTFSLSTALNPLSGIFFGPVAGAFCSAAGGFAGSFIAPHTAWLGPFTFLTGTVTAFTSGCIAWGKWPPVIVNKNGNFIINGAIIVYIIGTVLWFTQEIGRNILIFPLVFYGAGFIVMITGIIFVRRMFTGSFRILKFPAIWICAFAGLVGGASIGNFFSLVLYEQPKEFWTVLTFTAPFERAVFSLCAMFIGVPILEGINKIGIPCGPQDEIYED